MDDTARHLSLNVDSVAKALAEWTVSHHAETDPTLAGRYGAAWRRSWVDDVQHRIRHLAQSVAVRRPDVFAYTVAWSRAANGARDMPDDDLVASLGSLREIVASELPTATAEAALEHIDHAIANVGDPPALPAPGVRAADSPRRALVLTYLEHLLSGRRREAEQLILDHAAGGAAIAELYRDVLQPALVEIGTMWHLNEITIADEHFATAVTESVMSMLRTQYRREDSRGRTMIATTVSGELHALPVRIVADLFELDGWSAIYLGPNTPAEEIMRMVVDHGADLVALSTMSYLNLRTMADVVDVVHGLEGRPHVIVGGIPFQAIPDLWQEIGADGGAATAEEAVRVGNRLIGVSENGAGG
ncbi:MAG: cobalamin B12-binding domain-containing protein [Planctomycetota bacterium]